MPSVVECPSCGRKLSVPDNVPAERFQCPRCQTAFAATGLEALLPSPDEAVIAPLAEEPEPESDIPGLPPAPRLRAVLVSAADDPLPEPADDARDRVPCPFCKRPIRDDAERCPACRADLRSVRPRHFTEPRRDYEPHRGPLISTLGTVSILIGMLGLCGVAALPLVLAAVIGLSFGVAAWVMGHGDLEQMANHQMDPAGQESTATGQTNGIVGTVLGAVGILGGLLRLVTTLGDWL
jgi:Zn-finger nucleic acid-binding protein